ncbi:MAG: tetratricopeptide repeat protein [Myxococcota bacterium]|jgi:tetratricopeptide (TPR) repeat protein|nr:tetratricopeptide repeat protein [Myxococcota bacterium]
MSRDIHALEFSFARKPSLENCARLCEAYMQENRFMEAMVVCKKAIKSNPDDIRGPLLLTRIYAVQNKFAKAQKILHGILEKNPQNEVAKEMLEKLEAIKKQLHKTESTNVKSLLRSMPSLELPANLRAQAAAELDESTSLDVPTESPYATSNEARVADASRHTTQTLEPNLALEAPPKTEIESLEVLKQQEEEQIIAHTPASEIPQQANHEETFYSSAPAPDVSTPTRPPKQESAPQYRQEEKAALSPFKLILSLKWFPVLASLCLVVLLALGFQHLRKKYMERQFHIENLLTNTRQALGDDEYTRYLEAIDIAQEVLDIDATNEKALDYMALAYAILAQEHEVPRAQGKANDYLHLAAGLNENPSALRLVAQALIALNSKEYTPTINAIKRAPELVQAAPLLRLALFRLEYALAKENKSVKKPNIPSELLTPGAWKTRIYHRLGWYYLDQQNWLLAADYFNKSLQNNPNHVFSRLGKAHAILEERSEIARHETEINHNLQAILSLNTQSLSIPTRAFAHFVRAQLDLWNGHDQRARDAFLTAQQLSNSNDYYMHRYGVSLLRIGQPELAYKLFDELGKKFPDHFDYLKAKTHAQLALSDLNGARVTLQEILRTNPRDGEARILEGQRLRHEHQYEAAIASYSSIFPEDGIGDFALAQLGIGAALRESGKRYEASQHLENSIAAMPTDIESNIEAQLWCELGLAYALNRNREKAVQAFRAGIEQHQSYADCHYYLCKALRTGPEAREACRFYLKIEPRGTFASDARQWTD